MVFPADEPSSAELRLHPERRREEAGTAAAVVPARYLRKLRRESGLFMRSGMRGGGWEVMGKPSDTVVVEGALGTGEGILLHGLVVLLVTFNVDGG
jgi:hypothetical protein